MKTLHSASNAGHRLRDRVRRNLWRRATPVHCALLCAAALVACAAGGCTLLGVAAYKLAGDPEVAAQYVPAHEPIVVYIDRGNVPDEAQFDASRIARNVTEDLKTHKVAPTLDPTLLLDYRPRQRHGGSVWRASQVPTSGPATTLPTTPAELGKAVGAKQVLYVELLDFSIAPTLASELVKGRAEARVRIIDTATGEVRWPQDMTQGYMITASSPNAQSEKITSVGAARDELVQSMSDQIGRLFYKWKPDEMENATPMQ